MCWAASGMPCRVVRVWVWARLSTGWPDLSDGPWAPLHVRTDRFRGALCAYKRALRRRHPSWPAGRASVPALPPTLCFPSTLTRTRYSATPHRQPWRSRPSGEPHVCICACVGGVFPPYQACRACGACRLLHRPFPTACGFEGPGTTRRAVCLVPTETAAPRSGSCDCRCRNVKTTDQLLFSFPEMSYASTPGAHGQRPGQPI